MHAPPDSLTQECIDDYICELTVPNVINIHFLFANK